MQIELTPAMQAIVDEAMQTGELTSPQAVVEAALIAWRNVDLDVESWNQICEEALADDTPGIPVDTLRRRMMTYCNELVGHHASDAA